MRMVTVKPFLGTVIAVTSYWMFDGQTRNEGDWSNSAAYGIRIAGEVHANTISYGAGSSNMTFRYVDVGGGRAKRQITMRESASIRTWILFGGFGSFCGTGPFRQSYT